VYAESLLGKRALTSEGRLLHLQVDPAIMEKARLCVFDVSAKVDCTVEIKKIAQLFSFLE